MSRPLTNTNYVTKVLFPLEILPVSAVGGSFVHLAISAIPMFAGVLLLRHALPLTVLYLPVILLPLVLFCLGLSWLFASLGVFIRDVNSIVPVVVTVLMWISAVFYPLSKVPAQFLPLVRCNPLAVLIDQWRNAVLWGIAPDWLQYARVLLIGLATLLGGYAFFMRTKRAFADVL